ncbi:MAG: hypothetical protein J6B09_06685 [Clostridia bacterium]|nr:hypothetical protein [Clostridia bacterium]
MARKVLTDAEVELEIKRLKESPMVALGKVEERIRCRRRQYMYTLRQYEKRGMELDAAGVTVEKLLEKEKELRRAERAHVEK